jgi:NADH:ubiquinone oxidoreductase subunit 4 (subunit M)
LHPLSGFISLADLKQVQAHSISLRVAANPFTGGMTWLIMAGFLAGFLVKLPAFPVHSWLPDAHTDAQPTAGSLISCRTNA